eukprot:TRINITY_DN1807_c0_g1_i1.p1 TRINITY_DN1807_c0_g1~~TRINITY_DN1807_c0_g1_i1.p1  ORF type:complete len:335 (+),score=96.04 TRINITY_DN1807_c0_g1_i1:56-1006(+)
MLSLLALSAAALPLASRRWGASGSEAEPHLVPNVVHMVYGLERQKEPLPLYVALNIMAASHVLQPSALYMHHDHLPHGQWWDAVRHLVTLRPVAKPIVGPGGSRLPKRTAHKADIVRLQMLLRHGGIYLDSDVIVLKPFTPLLDEPMTMGLEWWATRAKAKGLCNAVMIASNTSQFLQRWYNEYKTVKWNCWACHSVNLPLRLAKTMPKNDPVQMPKEAFFYPACTQDELSLLYDTPPKAELGLSPPFPQKYAQHLWASQVAMAQQNGTLKRGLRDLTLVDACAERPATVYHSMLRFALRECRQFRDMCARVRVQH